VGKVARADSGAIMGWFLLGFVIGVIGTVSLVGAVVFFGGLALVLKFLGEKPMGG
jgi:hypothetical protein